MINPVHLSGSSAPGTIPRFAPIAAGARAAADATSFDSGTRFVGPSGLTPALAELVAEHDRIAPMLRHVTDCEAEAQTAIDACKAKGTRPTKIMERALRTAAQDAERLMLELEPVLFGIWSTEPATWAELAEIARVTRERVGVEDDGATCGVPSMPPIDFARHAVRLAATPSGAARLEKSVGTDHTHTPIRSEIADLVREIRRKEAATLAIADTIEARRHERPYPRMPEALLYQKGDEALHPLTSPVEDHRIKYQPDLAGRLWFGNAEHIVILQDLCGARPAEIVAALHSYHAAITEWADVEMADERAALHASAAEVRALRLEAAKIKPATIPDLFLKASLVVDSLDKLEELDEGIPEDLPDDEMLERKLPLDLARLYLIGQISNAPMIAQADGVAYLEQVAMGGLPSADWPLYHLFVRWVETDLEEATLWDEAEAVGEKHRVDSDAYRAVAGLARAATDRSIALRRSMLALPAASDQGVRIKACVYAKLCRGDAGMAENELLLREGGHVSPSDSAGDLDFALNIARDVARLGPPAVLCSGPARHGDAELIALGAELDRLWALETGDTDEGLDAATDRTGAIALAIESISPTTVEGLRVKARAAVWGYTGDTMGDEGTGDRIARRLLIDLGALDNLPAVASPLRADGVTFAGSINDEPIEPIEPARGRAA